MSPLVSVKRWAVARPLCSYFAWAYGIPWIAGGLLVGPRVLRGEPIATADYVLLFVSMLLGPSVAGFVMTLLVDGRPGLRTLATRLLRWRVPAYWYGVALLLFPLTIATLLGLLAIVGAPHFAPNFAGAGLLVGLAAGFCEEIGWTGFALPRLRARFGSLAAALTLGLLWGLWHVVADFAGSFAQLGSYWLPHFAAFVVAMAATRVWMVLVYNHSQSVLLAQLMHASSTGFLVTLGPVGLAPADETLWFWLYAIVLSVAAGGVVRVTGRGLVFRANALS